MERIILQRFFVAHYIFIYIFYFVLNLIKGLHFDSKKYIVFFPCLFKTHLALCKLIKKSSILQKKIFHEHHSGCSNPSRYRVWGLFEWKRRPRRWHGSPQHQSPPCFDSTYTLKINWTYVLFVFHQLNAVVTFATSSKSPRENVHARFRYQEYACMRAVPVSNVSFDNIVNQNASSPWRP